MKKEEIVKKLLDRGLMLSPETISSITDDNIDQYIDEKEDELKISMREVKENKKLTVQDFVEYYNSRFNGLKNILLKKVDAISINKLKKVYSDVSIIGMVKEMTSKGFVIEDPTGSIEAVSDKEVNTDDVIGIKGSVRENKIFVKELSYPDIPLNREVNKEGVKLELKDKKLKINEKTVAIKQNPAWIEIINGKNKTIVLVYGPPEDMEIKKAVEFLKKRHLCPDRKQIKSKEDVFLIDPVPDIFYFIVKEKGKYIYKGVTIISDS